MPRRDQYVQSTMLPPEAVEAVLRIGVVGAGNHAQLQYEIRNATDGELLAMVSAPHLEYGVLEVRAAEMLADCLRAMRAHVIPF